MSAVILMSVRNSENVSCNATMGAEFGRVAETDVNLQLKMRVKRFKHSAKPLHANQEPKITSIRKLV